MLPIILGGLALAGVGLVIYNELEEQSSVARNRWASKREDVQRSIEWHREQIKDHLNDAKQSYDFKTLIDMHFSCVKVADQAYLLLKDARLSLDKIGDALVEIKKQRELLFAKKKASKSKQERIEIQEEIVSIQRLRKKLFNDKDEIKQQRNILFLKVKDLNSKTHELKINIKERTGCKGADWYARLEARKKLKRHHQ